MSEQLPLFDRPNVKVIGRVTRTGRGSCIIAQPGDKRTLCGKKSAEVGVCWAHYVQAHIDGHNPPWCDECLYLWSKP